MDYILNYIEMELHMRYGAMIKMYKIYLTK